MSVDTQATVAASAQAYAQLAELELEFDQAEAELRMLATLYTPHHTSFPKSKFDSQRRRVLTQLQTKTTVKHQITLFEPIYTRRQAVLASIPSFWSIIFENFGPELDEHITPEDWAFLGENLTGVNVSRPDVASNNPRTFEITFGLKAGNGVVDAMEIKKKFMYRSLRDGDESWSGLISEPVEVKWASDEKDLAGGINGLSKKIFDVRKKRVEGRIEDKKNEGKGKGKKSQGKVKEDDGLSELELELEEKLNQTQSFFNWFSWTGDYFMVMEKEAEVRLREEKKAKGEEVTEDDEDEEQSETDGIDVFPDGEKLAYLIAEDMFPNALKHFGTPTPTPSLGLRNTNVFLFVIIHSRRNGAQRARRRRH